jgi:hypothetical protein
MNTNVLQKSVISSSNEVSPPERLVGQGISLKFTGQL